MKSVLLRKIQEYFHPELRLHREREEGREATMAAIMQNLGPITEEEVREAYEYAKRPTNLWAGDVAVREFKPNYLDMYIMARSLRKTMSQERAKELVKAAQKYLYISDMAKIKDRIAEISGFTSEEAEAREVLANMSVNFEPMSEKERWAVGVLKRGGEGDD